MNLELPLDDVPSRELDEALARIDRELDTLFLGAIAEAFHHVPVEPDVPEAATA